MCRMKKWLLILIIVGLPTVLYAQRVGRTLINMEKLYKNGHVLQAMDSAAYVLSIDHDNMVAKIFMHEHWDKAMKELEHKLAPLTDETSVDQARERLLLFKLVDEIHTYLRTVPMPFYGPNERWVWQPEVGYYAGMYDNERMKAFPLMLAAADEALQSYDVELARTYYDFIRKELFVTEGERKSNEVVILQSLNTRIDSLAQSRNIYEAIVVYDMIGLSLWLDASQEDRVAQRVAMQKRIADLYLQLANEYEAQGDTVLARENRLMAEDWKVIQ